MLAWDVCGGLLLWFSFATIFVLAGMGMAICPPALRQRDWKRLAGYLVPCGLWLVSFGTLYVLFVSKYHKSEWLTYFFKIRNNAYLPLTEPATALHWLAVKLYAFLDHPLGLLLDVNVGRSAVMSAFFKLETLQARRFYNQSCYRETLLYVNDHVQPSDGVYVYWNMRPAYNYYHDAYTS